LKVMNLKLQVPSLVGAHLKDLRGSLNKIFTFVPNFVFVILCFFFIMRAPKLYKLQATQNMDLPP